MLRHTCTAVVRDRGFDGSNESGVCGCRLSEGGAYDVVESSGVDQGDRACCIYCKAMQYIGRSV